jgi:hypothetical protein
MLSKLDACVQSDFSRHVEKSMLDLTPQPPSHPSRSPLLLGDGRGRSLFFTEGGEFKASLLGGERFGERFSKSPEK